MNHDTDILLYILSIIPPFLLSLVRPQERLTMAPQYAKDQPPQFTNGIERVAIIGVSQFHLFKCLLIDLGRLVVKWALTSSKVFRTPANMS